MSDPMNVLAQLQALRTAYAAQLADRVTQVEASWAALAAGSAGELARELHQLTHRLAGTAPTFGFVELGRAARAIELLVQPVIEQQRELSPAERQQIELALAQMRAALDGTEAAHQPYLAFEQRTGTTHSRRILIVDDDEQLGQDLALQIGHFGYEVEAYADLASFDTAFDRAPVAAVLVDLGFPEGEVAGAHLITRLRQVHHDLPPVVIISARTDFAARLEAVRAQADAYFTKPINIGQLIERIDQLTNQRPPEPIKILIVDDDADLAAHHAGLLTQADAHIQIEQVNDPLLAMERLMEFAPDLLLVDLYMPGCSGMELARVIRQQDAFASLPIVFLSSETGAEPQQTAIEAGGDDFLTKPVNTAALLSAVKTRARRSRLMRSLMVRDSLTGLLNHTTSNERLAIEVARAQRLHTSLAVAMIDIDYFKQVNDTFGHPTGDRVLRSLANRLRRLRLTDAVGRYGGEEFIVILPDTNVTQARRLIEDIRQTFAQVRHRADSGVEFSVTFSCGIAAYPQLADAPVLVSSADRCLYMAKRNGRNQTVVATALSGEADERAALPVVEAPPAVAALVIDDDPDLQQLLFQVLSARGLAVLQATDADQALKILGEGSLPDLVFLDVQLPGRSGLDLLPNLRALLADAAIVMSTGFGSEKVAVEAMRRGADDYLRKPIDLVELEAVIERTIARLDLSRQNALLRLRIADLNRRRPS